MSARRYYRVTGLLLGLSLGIGISQASTTPNYLFDDRTAPDTANIEDTPMGSSQKDRDYEEEVASEPSIIPVVADWTAEQDPFIRDTILDLHFRSYFMNADNGGPHESQAWAGGGSLVYKSGYWKDFIAIGASGFTTQPISAPDWGKGTRLLGPDQKGFSVLGTAYVELKADKIRGRFYRQIIDTPYLNQQDNRMIPNTFEAYVIGSRDLRPVSFILGQVTKVKRRDSTSFESIGDGLGANKTTAGITMTGFRAYPSEHVTAGMINYYVWDIANVYYTEVDADIPMDDPWSMSLGFQFSDQRNAGESLLGQFSSQQVGATASLGYDGAVLGIGVSKVLTDNSMLSPFGSYPGFTSMIVEDFNRAQQTSLVVGISYDFGEIGLEGFSGFTNYGYAWADHTAITNSPPRTEEFDITLDYRFQDGILKNLWFRARAAWVSFDDAPNRPYSAINDYRIIINYDIPLL